MRQVNMSAVLEIMRKHSPISRTEIAEQLNVSLPTVMRIIDTLIEEDLVRPAGGVRTSGGRPRTLLELNVSAHAIIGVDLRGSHMYGALVNIGGQVIDELYMDRAGATGEAAFEKLCMLIDHLRQSAHLGETSIRGIGVGAPGVTLHREGIITWAPGLEWWDYPLRDKLLGRFNLPVIVDNDVNLATLGEHWFGVARNSRNMVLIALGMGVGAGIIIDGVLYRGHHETSGEVGYLPPDRSFLGRRYEGFGPLESRASSSAIVERARRMLADRLSPQELEAMSFDYVLSAYAQGLDWAQLVVEEAADYLALALAAVGALLDPEVIVLGGDISESGGRANLFIEQIQQRITGVIPSVPRIVASDLGARATVLGTITSSLHQILDYYVVRRIS
jgi:predicted NBD/HSP70 family sugar kinase